jgi:hypothetical protein
VAPAEVVKKSPGRDRPVGKDFYQLTLEQGTVNAFSVEGASSPSPCNAAATPTSEWLVTSGPAAATSILSPPLSSQRYGPCHPPEVAS